MPVRCSWKPRRIGSEDCAWTKRGKPPAAVSAPPAASPFSTSAPPERADPIRRHWPLRCRGAPVCPGGSHRKACGAAGEMSTGLFRRGIFASPTPALTMLLILGVRLGRRGNGDMTRMAGRRCAAAALVAVSIVRADLGGRTSARTSCSTDGGRVLGGHRLSRHGGARLRPARRCVTARRAFAGFGETATGSGREPTRYDHADRHRSARSSAARTLASTGGRRTRSG